VWICVGTKLLPNQQTFKVEDIEKKRNNYGTTKHNTATQPLLGVCSSLEFDTICKGTVTLLRITTSKVSPVTT